MARGTAAYTLLWGKKRDMQLCTSHHQRCSSSCTDGLVLCQNTHTHAISETLYSYMQQETRADPLKFNDGDV